MKFITRILLIIGSILAVALSSGEMAQAAFSVPLIANSTTSQWAYPQWGGSVLNPALEAPYFTATSTTATSTFAGPVQIGTSTLWSTLSIYGQNYGLNVAPDGLDVYAANGTTTNYSLTQGQGGSINLVAGDAGGDIYPSTINPFLGGGVAGKILIETQNGGGSFAGNGNPGGDITIQTGKGGDSPSATIGRGGNIYFLVGTGRDGGNENYSSDNGTIDIGTTTVAGTHQAILNIDGGHNVEGLNNGAVGYGIYVEGGNGIGDGSGGPIYFSSGSAGATDSTGYGNAGNFTFLAGNGGNTGSGTGGTAGSYIFTAGNSGNGFNSVNQGGGFNLTTGNSGSATIGSAVGGDFVLNFGTGTNGGRSGEAIINGNEYLNGNLLDSSNSAGSSGNVLINSLSTGKPVWVATSSLGISGGTTLSGGGLNALTYWTGASTVGATSSPTAGIYTSTSTTNHSTFPYASTTAITSVTASTTNLLVSSLTKGSIPFASTAGLLSQDNANFFWDAANKRLGIGLNTPAVAAQIGNLTAGVLNTLGLQGDQNGGSIGGSGAANEATLGGYYTSNPIPGSSISFGAQGGAGQQGGITFNTKNTDDNTNIPTVRGVVTAGGFWGLGSQTNPQTLLDVAGDITDENVQNCNGPSSALYTDYNGVIYCGSGISDARLKTNETPLAATSTLQSVLSLTPITYHYTNAYVNSKQGILEGLSTSTEMVGFLAQNVQSVFPDVVSTTTVRVSTTTTQQVLTIDYQHLSVYLFSALKAQQAEIDAINMRLTNAGIK